MRLTDLISLFLSVLHTASVHPELKEQTVTSFSKRPVKSCMIHSYGGTYFHLTSPQPDTSLLMLGTIDTGLFIMQCILFAPPQHPLDSLHLPHREDWVQSLPSYSCQNSLRTQRWTYIPVLTRLNVEQLWWSRPMHYLSAKLPHGNIQSRANKTTLVTEKPEYIGITSLTDSAVMTLPSRSTAPSARTIIFSRWPCLRCCQHSYPCLTATSSQYQ